MPRVLSPLWHVETGKRLRRMRDAKGFTQQAVADVLECSFQMVQKYEKATARLPADTAITLAELYRVDIKQLLGME